MQYAIGFIAGAIFTLICLVYIFSRCIRKGKFQVHDWKFKIEEVS